MSEVIKRNIDLNKIIVDVTLDPDDKDRRKYMACILLSHKELKETLRIDLQTLQKVLVSQSKQVLGFVFKYFDENNQKRRDTLISKKISNDQIIRMNYCLPDNAYVVITSEEGLMIDGKQVPLEIK